jgi:L-arabinokinase
MGHAIILAHLRALGTVADDPFGGYVCNILPEEYALAYRAFVPTEMRGQEFLDRYGDTVDPVTRVEPDKTYKIRSRLEHHIYEQARVQRFLSSLESYGRTRETAFLVEAGRQMMGSHWSYGNRCGMGAAETDLLVALAQEIGPAGGVYGAKITGGGSGGTVALLGDDRLPAVVSQIAQRYAEATGITPDLFQGSSPGALACGTRVCRV